MQVDRDLVQAARDGDREAYAYLIRARGDLGTPAADQAAAQSIVDSMTFTP